MLFKCPQCGKVIDMTLEELALSKKVVVCPQCLNEFLAKDVDIPASMLRTNIATQSAHKQLYCHSCGESLCDLFRRIHFQAPDMNSRRVHAQYRLRPDVE